MNILCFVKKGEGVIKEKEWIVYAEEADILNVAIFGCTAKIWREANAELIRNKIDKKERFEKLKNIAQYQKNVLDKQDYLKSLKKINNEIYIKNR